MRTLAGLAILILTTSAQGSEVSRSAGCGEKPVSYKEGIWKTKKFSHFLDQFAVQGEVERTYRVRLPKSKSNSLKSSFL